MTRPWSEGPLPPPHDQAELGATRLFLLQCKTEALGFQGAETMLFLIFPRGLKPESLCPPARRPPVPAATSRALFVQAALDQLPVAMASTAALRGRQSDKHGVGTGRAGKTHATPGENPGERKMPSTQAEGLGGALRLGQPGTEGLPAGGSYSRTPMLAYWL